MQSITGSDIRVGDKIYIDFHYRNNDIAYIEITEVQVEGQFVSVKGNPVNCEIKEAGCLITTELMKILD